MTEDANTAHFFSSPGDVAAERAAVCRVLDELEGNHLLHGKVNFQLVAWDDPYAAESRGQTRMALT